MNEIPGSFKENILVAISALLIITTLSSCTKVESIDYVEQRKEAEKARFDFYEKYNDKKFIEIYNSASPTFKASVQSQQMIEASEQTFSKFGKILDSTEVATACSPHEVRMVRYIKFENGDGGEMSTWSVNDGKATLTLFQIQSGKPALPTKEYRDCNMKSVLITPAQ